MLLASVSDAGVVEVVAILFCCFLLRVGTQLERGLVWNRAGDFLHLHKRQVSQGFQDFVDLVEAEI